MKPEADQGSAPCPDWQKLAEGVDRLIEQVDKLTERVEKLQDRLDR